MILKKRTKPLQLQKVEALLSRLPLSHKKRPRVQEDYAKQLAGYKGELAIEYPLSFLDHQKFLILHDIRLNDSAHFFQMDSLLLASNVIIILEVKNIAGTLIFDTAFKQLIRILDNKEEAFPCPIYQVKTHVQQLQAWLNRAGYPSIPIEPLVVSANERSVIRSSDPEVPRLVIPHKVLTRKVNELATAHQKKKIQFPQLKTLANQIIQNHTESADSILEFYQIPQTDLYKGVQCPQCYRHSMERKYGKWACHFCETTSKKAHVHALKDYSLLIDPTITNQLAKDYLLVPSGDCIKRLLAYLPAKGKNKGRKYILV